MVVFINESNNNNNKSIDSIVNEFNLSVMELCHECEMSTLQSRYDYVVENGYEMALYEADNAKQNIFKRFIHTIVEKFTKLYNDLVAWCKKHYNGSKLQTIVNSVKSKFTKGKKDIESSTTPEEAKEASKQASEEMKNEAKQDQDEDKSKKKLRHKTYNFISFNEDMFWKAIEEKDYIRLKVGIVSCMRNDPTFERGEIKQALSILHKYVPEIFEEEKELDYEERLEKDKWDKRYFTKLTYWFQENFAESRILYIKEVGRTVHKDTAEKYRASLEIGRKLKKKY